MKSLRGHRFSARLDPDSCTIILTADPRGSIGLRDANAPKMNKPYPFVRLQAAALVERLIVWKFSSELKWGVSTISIQVPEEFWAMRGTKDAVKNRPYSVLKYENRLIENKSVPVIVCRRSNCDGEDFKT